MSSGLAIVCVLALMCAAGGLLLWQRAQDERERTLTERFVSRALHSGGQETVAGEKSFARESSQQAQPATQGSPGRGPGPAAKPSAAVPQGLRARMRHRQAYVAYVFNNLMSRAGIDNVRAFLSISVAVVSLGTLWIAARTHLVIGLAFAAVAVLCLYAVLVWRAQKRRRRISRQLPVFLDGIVRLITIGNSVPASFQAALQNTEIPLRECLDRVSRMLRAGVDIDQALTHVATVYRVRDLEMIGAVLRVSVKYGGRSDLMLDRMAALMRDLEQADRELVALSTETRLSSWVLGLMPVLLGGYMVIANPRYFDAMWGDPSGKQLVFAAVGLQILGAFLLYRLARLRD
jgi:tight adherence protein B